MEIYFPPWILLPLPSWIIICQDCLREVRNANKGEICDQHLLYEQSKDHFIDDIVDIALFATQIPLSIFTNLFHQRFQKHPMLESTLEILQQFYIQVETQSDEFHLFGGDLSTYMLRCKRCGQCVTLHGSIGETLYHVPAAMLYYWKIIEPHDEQIHRQLMLMPLLCASYDNLLIIKFFLWRL